LKTAIIVGATGLTGKALTQVLCQSNNYDKVILLLRKPLRILDSKVEQHTIDFNTIDKYKHLLHATHLYICIGSTMKKAGSKEAFIHSDVDIPFEIAKVCKENNVKSCVFISAVGANLNSQNFYLKTKGEIEKLLFDLQFENLHIMRPSMLLGKRDESRLGESIGKIVAKMLSLFLVLKLKKYKPIEAQVLAIAMYETANNLNHSSQEYYFLEKVSYHNQ
jgi:uncharacterized protein YbjT (DUF2867 family)